MGAPMDTPAVTATPYPPSCLIVLSNTPSAFASFPATASRSTSPSGTIARSASPRQYLAAALADAHRQPHSYSTLTSSRFASTAEMAMRLKTRMPTAAACVPPLVSAHWTRPHFDVPGDTPGLPHGDPAADGQAQR